MFILTVNEMMQKGLELSGFALCRQQKVDPKTNLQRFKAYYGSAPIVYAQIWEDLQTTDIPEASISDENIDSFLMTMHFLKCYPTEVQLAGTFKICERTAREWVWYYAKKVQALKSEKIVWSYDNNVEQADTIFIVSVDGTHCRVNEPTHPTMSKNPAYYSHKFNQAGLNYEIALSISESKLVWVNGPFKASESDIAVFRKQGGLKDKIPAGMIGIGDKGYRGERGILSTPNSHDLEELRKFKSRARSRHETFNGRLKNFKCLDHRFRHGIHKHQIVFEAVCVIVQYQMENGSPLFDV